MSVTNDSLQPYLAAAVAALTEDAHRGRNFLMAQFPELGKGQADRLAAMAQGIILMGKVHNPIEKCEAAIVSALRAAGVNGTTMAELAVKLGIQEKDIAETIISLQAKKYMIEADYPLVRLKTWVEPQNKVKVDVRKYADAPNFTIGIIADSHLGSKYSRLDVLEAMYDIFKQEGVSFVYQLGNLLDGYQARFNAGDLLPGMDRLDNQVDYAIDSLPQREGITTRFLTAECHEGWWIKPTGINIGEHIEDRAQRKGRSDIRWLGHIETDVEFKFAKGSAIMRCVHPGGGNAYAASYPLQRLIESYSVNDTPQILAAGHYHKFLTMRSRDCHVVMGGCTQAQTPFMRKHHIQAHLGGMVIRCKFDEYGSVLKFAPEWFPFSTEKYYEQNKLYLPV